MSTAGTPAASRPRADHRGLDPAPGTRLPAAEDFDAFLADARARRATDAVRTAREDAGQAVPRPEDWADPDPAAARDLPAGRHPVDRALRRSKEGSTRATFAGTLRGALALLTGAERRSVTDQDVRAYPWHHLTVEDAAEYRAAVYRRYRSQGTRNDRVCTVRRMVDECYRARLISALRRDLLMDELYTLAVGESTRRRRLSLEEINALMVACDRIGDRRTTARNTAIVALFRSTGMRIGELVNIRLADWDRTDHSILLPDTKNGRSHRVFVHPGAVPYLERWLALRGEGDGALFTALNRANRQPLHPFSVRYMLRTRAEAAGVAPFGSHDFRRTFATDLLESHDPFLVGKLLNHRKVESTMVYDLRPERARRDAVATLGLVSMAELPTLTAHVGGSR